jgi:type VI secretion system protein ImpM
VNVHKLAAVSASAPALPGWFGKLPGMGDFAHRRLSASFREHWDDWLQDGLAGLRTRHPQDWIEHYLESPLWCFALGADTVDAQTWIGVLMPSVDSAGRYFPFTLACVWDADAVGWWSCAASVALQALEADLDAARLENLLAERFGMAVAAGEIPGTALVPPPGQSLWHTDLADAAWQCVGLPHGAQFDALFGFVYAVQDGRDE